MRIKNEVWKWSPNPVLLYTKHRVKNCGKPFVVLGLGTYRWGIRAPDLRSNVQTIESPKTSFADVNDNQTNFLLTHRLVLILYTRFWKIKMHTFLTYFRTTFGNPFSIRDKITVPGMRTRKTCSFLFTRPHLAAKQIILKPKRSFTKVYESQSSVK